MSGNIPDGPIPRAKVRIAPRPIPRPKVPIAPDVRLDPGILDPAELTSQEVKIAMDQRTPALIKPAMAENNVGVKTDGRPDARTDDSNESSRPNAPEKPKEPEKPEDPRCGELQAEMEGLNVYKIMPLVRKIHELEKELENRKAGLESLRRSAPFSITLPAWIEKAKRRTPAGLGLEIGQIIGNVIVGKMNDDRMLSHKEQVALDEFVVKTLHQGLEKLKAEEREFSAQLEDKRREFEDLKCGRQRKKRRPMV